MDTYARMKGSQLERIVKNGAGYKALVTPSLRQWRGSAILFSLIVACLFGLSGLLAGSYVWDRFGPLARDPDNTEGYFCGLLVGGAMAIGAGVTLLFKFWPRSTTTASQSSEPRGRG